MYESALHAAPAATGVTATGAHQRRPAAAAVLLLLKVWIRWLG